jgi:hypothetical protein
MPPARHGKDRRPGQPRSTPLRGPHRFVRRWASVSGPHRLTHRSPRRRYRWQNCPRYRPRPCRPAKVPKGRSARRQRAPGQVRRREVFQSVARCPRAPARRCSIAGCTHDLPHSPRRAGRRHRARFPPRMPSAPGRPSGLPTGCTSPPCEIVEFPASSNHHSLKPCGPGLRAAHCAHIARPCQIHVLDQRDSTQYPRLLTSGAHW